MKTPVLVSSALGAIGLLVLAVGALPHVGPMITVPFEQGLADTFGEGAQNARVEGIVEARAGWTRVSVGLALVASLACGWLWVPLERRVREWADRQPAIKKLFTHKNVTFVSDAPTEGFILLAVWAVFPFWLLLPGLHVLIGRTLLPVPNHLIEPGGAAFLLCLPLAIGYGMLWRSRRGGRARPEIGA